jgi:histidine ammonia-lyase
MDRIVLNGKNLTADIIDKIADNLIVVDIDKNSMERLVESRRFVLGLCDSHKPVYGLNTGLGANKDVRISLEEIKEYNEKIILSHCIGIEPYANIKTVRAVLAVRLNTLLVGATGIQPDIAVMYKEFLNRNIIPVLPLRGSVSMADIGTLSHIGLAMIGRGEVYYKNSKRSASEVLEIEGLNMIELGPKDALAILSSNAMTAGRAALLVNEVKRIINLADLVYSLSFEAADLNPMFLDKRANNLRPLNGQKCSLNEVNKNLEGSYLFERNNDSLGGTICLKSSWAIHGSIRDTVEYVEKQLNVQLNSSDDCPYVIVEDEEIISTPNFIITSLVLSLEMMNIGLGHLSKCSCFRHLRLHDPRTTNLSRFLRFGEDVIGLSTMSRTFTSLDAENTDLVNVTSLDFMAVSNDTEDYATNGARVIEKGMKIIDNLYYIFGMEALSAAQGIDLKGDIKLGKKTGLLFKKIRETVDFMKEDRNVSIDIKKMYDIMKEIELS